MSLALLLSIAFGTPVTASLPPECSLLGSYGSSPTSLSPIATLGGTRPDVLSGWFGLVRHRGRDGVTLWRQPKGSGMATLVAGTSGREQIRTVREEGCGAVRVASIDPRTGTTTGTVLIPAVSRNTTAVIEIFNAGLGDWDGDRKQDVLLLQVAGDGAVAHDGSGETLAAYSYVIGQPSGHVLMVGPSWHAYMTVVGGNGRVLLRQDLGDGRGAAPTARWSGDGHDVILALPDPAGASVLVSQRSSKGTRWRATITGVGTDVMVLPQTNGVAVLTSTASSAWQAHAVTATGLSAQGRALWTATRQGSLSLLPAGRALDLVDVMSGMAEQIRLDSGSTVWTSHLASPLGPLQTYLPQVVGDLDGHGAPDLVLAGAMETSVLSGETGQVMYSYPLERTFGVPNLDEQLGADLITTEKDQDGHGEVVRLRRGTTGAQVWAADVRLGLDAQDTEAVAGSAGSVGFVALHDFSGMVSVLNSSNGGVRWVAPDS